MRTTTPTSTSSAWPTHPTSSLGGSTRRAAPGESDTLQSRTLEKTRDKTRLLREFPTTQEGGGLPGVRQLLLVQGHGPLVPGICLRPGSQRERPLGAVWDAVQVPALRGERSFHHGQLEGQRHLKGSGEK